jgi:hypothetical protein
VQKVDRAGAALFASTKSLLACMDDGRHAKEVSVGRAGLSQARAQYFNFSVLFFFWRFPSEHTKTKKFQSLQINSKDALSLGTCMIETSALACCWQRIYYSYHKHHHEWLLCTSQFGCWIRRWFRGSIGSNHVGCRFKTH